MDILHRRFTVTEMGRLKMQDLKMTDLTVTDQVVRVDNDVPDFDGPKRMGGN